MDENIATGNRVDHSFKPNIFTKGTVKYIRIGGL
jgi:hypothetical protein